MITVKKRFIAILAVISIVSGAAAYYARNRYGGATVSRGTFGFAAKQTVFIESAGLPVTVAACYGDFITVEYAAELPIIVEETDEDIKIAQDDGFAVSVLASLDYYIKVGLPAGVRYKKVAVSTAGGGVNADAAGLDMRNLTVTTKNGGINIASANSYMKLTSASGGINVDYDSFLYNTSIESGSGGVNLSIPDYCSLNLNFQTKTGHITTSFFSREYAAYRGALFEKRGNSRSRLYVGTESADLFIKEKDTNVIGNYPRL